LSLTSSREEAPAGAVTDLAAKQRRSQITYDKLIAAGFRLLEQRELDAVPVAEIAERAGYSVGAFYARFKNKEDFHHALVRHHVAERLIALERILTEISDEELLSAYFTNVVNTLWRNRFFWRACLFCSIQDPRFWEPFRDMFRIISDRLVARASQRAGRDLTNTEEMDIRFALQVTNGAINNGMINRPGAASIEDPDFIERLERAFRAVSGWDLLR